MVVLDIRRGTWRRETLLETYGNTTEAVEVPEPPAFDADKLAGCLQALAERERSVVIQTFFADRSGDELAKELGLSAGNVRVIRHRALARLRECMDGGVS
jgi:RNA polymerase sigma-70 factor (ECF subfamily)